MSTDDDSIGTRNRRRFVRLYRSFPCRFRVVRSDGSPVSEEEYEAETKDISLGGVGILCRSFPDSGATSLLEGRRRLRFRFDFGVDFGVIEADLRLRWMEKGDDGVYGCGVEFVALEGPERKRLSNVLHNATEFRRQLALWETDSHRKVSLRRRYATVVSVLAAIFAAGILLLAWGLKLHEGLMAGADSRRFAEPAKKEAPLRQAAAGEEPAETR